MDILTLATTALKLLSPFIEKIGEASAKKVGEDLWNLIKVPFKKKDKDIQKMDKDEIQSSLIDILNEDASFRSELENFVTNAQVRIDNINQSIVNNGRIEKQVNVGNINGNVTL